MTRPEDVARVTRARKPVAELRPPRRPIVSARTLPETWRRLPVMDPRGLRADLDTVADPAL